MLPPAGEQLDAIMCHVTDLFKLIPVGKEGLTSSCPHEDEETYESSSDSDDFWTTEYAPNNDNWE